MGCSSQARPTLGIRVPAHNLWTIVNLWMTKGRTAQRRGGGMEQEGGEGGGAVVMGYTELIKTELMVQF